MLSIKARKSLIFLWLLLFATTGHAWVGARLVAIDPPYPSPRTSVQVSRVFLNPIPLLDLAEGRAILVTPQGGVQLLNRWGGKENYALLPEPLETPGILKEDQLFLITGEGRLFSLAITDFSYHLIRDGLPVAVRGGCTLEDVLYWRDNGGGVFATTVTGAILFRYEGEVRERIAARGGAGIYCSKELTEGVLMTTQGKILWVRGGKLLRSAVLTESGVQEGYADHLWVQVEKDRFFFCLVRTSCYLMRYSSGEVLGRFAVGSLDGPKSFVQWIALLSSDGDLLIFDEYFNLLFKNPVFLEPGWLVILQGDSSLGKGLSRMKLWAVSQSGKLVELTLDKNLHRMDLRTLARIYTGVSSSGWMPGPGEWWVPSGYGSLYRFLLR